MNEHSRSIRAIFIFIITAAMLLVSAAGCQVAVSSDITGPWHNEQLNEVVRFHDDGTAVIRTAEGDFEAKYVFDKSSSQGVITLNGTAINFTPVGESLMLTMGDTQSEFTRGDMEVKVAIVTEAPTVTPTEAPTEAPTEEPTEAPTEEPTEAPTDSPSPHISLGPFPDVSFHPLPTPKVSLGQIPKISGFKPGDILGGLTSITGDWYYKQDHNFVLTLNADKTFVMQSSGVGVSGIYTYDKTSKTGTLSANGVHEDFTVSGDTLTMNSGTVFER